MAERDPAPIDALDELYEILLLGALDEPQQRLTATRYTLCREVLLRSALRPMLPGFLQQCLTFDRFRDFIHLYHPSLNARVEMIDDALRASLGRARDGRTKGVAERPGRDRADERARPPAAGLPAHPARSRSISALERGLLFRAVPPLRRPSSSALPMAAGSAAARASGSSGARSGRRASPRRRC